MKLSILDAFISGMLLIAIPIILVENNIEPIVIGGIFALMPIIFQAIRLVSASLSDQIGTKTFYILNGIFNFLQAIFFIIAVTPFFYTLGKISESLRGAFFWAVIRTNLAAYAPNAPQKEYSKHSRYRFLTIAIATTMSGAMLSFLDYRFIFVLVALIAIVITYLAFIVREPIEPKEVNPKILLKNLDFREKPKKLQEASEILLTSIFSFDNFLVLGLPLFLVFRGFAANEIGLMFTIYYVLIYVAMKFSNKYNVNIKLNSWIAGLLYAMSLLILFIVPNELFWPIIAMLALAEGLAMRTWESVIVYGIKGSKTMSSDIGLVHVPNKIGSAVVLFLTGAIIQFFGFFPIVVLAAISALVFGFTAGRLLEE